MTLPANESGLHASETYEYDENASGSPAAGRGQVTKILHADGKYQLFDYDAYGNKLWEENELRRRINYEYDSYNRLTKVTDPLQKFETLSYLKPGASSSYLHTTNSVYTHTSRTYIATTNVYDANFRKTSTTVTGKTTWFHYDFVGNLDCVTDPRGSGPCVSPTQHLDYTARTEYDTRNRKWHLWDAEDHQTTFTYDSASNVTRIDHPDGGWETKGYDAMNRVGVHTKLNSPNP